MGGEHSVGQDNDDLIDKLKEKDYIRTVEVERVFRMVDRAHYYLEENRKTAYEDIAWRNGLLHMSAPCIYSKVMEALELGKGMSFINLGSGTGYLNTLVGYAIGPYGINHGIELHADNVTYAKERLEEFIQKAPRFDDLELCEPQFVVGNCLNLSVENRLYDRVYCGAACPPERQEVLQNMVKVGGILVTPVGDQLLKIKRLGPTEFTSENILPVSFASLIVPSHTENPDEAVIMPEVHPLSLQSISRISIRNAIRSTFEFNLPVPKASKSCRKVRRPETSSSSLYRGLASFNFVPTRNGIMVMGFGGPGNGAWPPHILPLSRRRAGAENAAAESDSDDSTAGDFDEEEEDDGNLLDHQLHIHAQALRHLRERSGLDPSQDRDVGSDVEEAHNPDLSSSEDVNGNSTSRAAEASTSGNSFENQSTDGKNEGSSKNNKEECDMTTDALFSGTDDRVSKKQPALKFYKHFESKHDSLAFKDKNKLLESLEHPSDVIISACESQSSASMVIDVPTTGIPIQQNMSYSTSAETSETSGFGSLGDDAALLPGSFKESSASPDKFRAATSDVGDNSWHSSSGMDHEETERDEIESHCDVAWMDEEEESNVAQEKVSTEAENQVGQIDNSGNEDAESGLEKFLSDVGLEQDKYDSDDEISRRLLSRFPRFSKKRNSDTTSEDSDNSKETEESGDEETEAKKAESAPSFSSFLKEKVDTLPIPNSIKAFVLHYR